MLRKRPKQLLFSAPPFSPEALGGVGSQGSEAGEGRLEKRSKKNSAERRPSTKLCFPKNRAEGGGGCGGF